MSFFGSSLHQEGGKRLGAFESVSLYDLLDGDVSSRDEADEPDEANGGVFDGDKRRKTLRVESEDLQDGREDQRQKTAADRTDQWDDEVQLWDQDGQSACEEDEDGAQQHVHGSLPSHRHTSQHRGDEDLRRDVELQGESDEDTERVEKLHPLVGPAVWQVEGDASSDGVSKAQIPDGAEGDVEEGDDAHPQI